MDGFIGHSLTLSGGGGQCDLSRRTLLEGILQRISEAARLIVQAPIPVTQKGEALRRLAVPLPFDRLLFSERSRRWRRS